MKISKKTVEREKKINKDIYWYIHMFFCFFFKHAQVMLYT